MLLLVLLTWLHTAAPLQMNVPAAVKELQVELGMYTGNRLWGEVFLLFSISITFLLQFSQSNVSALPALTQHIPLSAFSRISSIQQSHSLMVTVPCCTSCYLYKYKLFFQMAVSAFKKSCFV